MNPPRKIPVNELRPGMTVVAISGFSNDYATLSSRHIVKLKEEFSGAQADVKRRSQPMSVSVPELAPFDELVRIKNIPTGWPKQPITQELLAQLHGRGFRAFEVTGNGSELPLAPTAPAPAKPAAPAAAKPTAPAAANPTAPAAAKPAPAAAPAAPAVAKTAAPQENPRIAKARQFVESITQATEQREESRGVVEELLDKGRLGKVDPSGLKNTINQILDSNTAASIQAITGLVQDDDTYAHGSELASLFMEVQSALSDLARKSAEREEVNRKGRELIMMAGFMHDIGNCKVSKEILDSPKGFAPGSPELLELYSHVDHGARILTDLGMDGLIVNIAHYHHVKKNTAATNSYPNVPFDQLHNMTRLVAIIEVYLALVTHRPYRRGRTPAKAVEIITESSGKDFDEGMTRLFLQVMGRYPVGSLVRMNTGDVAFVIGQSARAADRPIVAMIENAKGEPLTHHTMVDMMSNLTLKVKEALDPFDHFTQSGRTPYEAFANLKL